MGRFDLPISGKAAVAAEPSEGALDDSTLGLEREAAVGPDEAQPANHHAVKSRVFAPPQSWIAAEWTKTASNSPRLSTKKCHFRPKDIRSRIKPTLCALASSFNALAIEGRCRGCFFFGLRAHAVAQSGVELLPYALILPLGD